MKTPQRILRELSQPFKQEDLEFRPQQAGANNGKPYAMLLAYVTNRAIQQRLDDVVGCFGWKNQFKPLPNSVGEGALCGISLEINGKWVTKWDGADNTAIESTKGGLSGAMKRTAVQWGIGRYLYDIPAMWGICLIEEEFKKLNKDEKQKYTRVQTKNKDVTFYWAAPKLADIYLPQKYITPSITKSIEELAEKTETKMEDIIANYGVDDIRDLFAHEAGQITNLLLKKLKRMNNEDS